MLRVGMARVRGQSMEPTLREGDRLLVRYGVSPRPGQVAVIRLPGVDGLSIKRVVGRDGDRWWVERDNPARGVDSWLVGGVREADVIAVAVLRIWPRPGRLHRRTSGDLGGGGDPAGT